MKVSGKKTKCMAKELINIEGNATYNYSSNPLVVTNTVGSGKKIKCIFTEVITTGIITIVTIYLIYSNGNCYMGEMHEDWKQGQGTFYYSEWGSRYEGKFIANKPSQRGTYFWKDGSRYEVRALL
jgi:hypothetical protein